MKANMNSKKIAIISGIGMIAFIIALSLFLEHGLPNNSNQSSIEYDALTHATDSATQPPNLESDSIGNEDRTPYYGQVSASYEALIPLLRAVQSDFAPTYHEFVGGIYFNNFGHMVLQILENCPTREFEEYYLVRRFLAGGAYGVIIEYVEFSHNELNDMMGILNALALPNVTALGLNTSNNRIVVRLLVYNEEEITRFRETISDSPIITFVESEGEFVLRPKVHKNLIEKLTHLARLEACIGQLGLTTI